MVSGEPNNKRKSSGRLDSSPQKQRKNTHEDEDEDEDMAEVERDVAVAEEMPVSRSKVDAQINREAAITYWSSVPASDHGVLGGYPEVSRVDLQGSANFLAKLRRSSTQYPPSAGKLKRVADTGAGIGRVTRGFLCNISDLVDVVEPVSKFTKSLTTESYVGTIYNCGLEDWTPETNYDVIWNQWCVGQIRDDQLVEYLKRIATFLNPGGWIVVKENISNHVLGEDVYDETDSSVTRTHEHFKEIWDRAGLRVVSTEVQKGFPKVLYPVRSYALQPHK